MSFKRIFIIAFALLFCCFSSCLAKDFLDISKTYWANEYISTLSDMGIIDGFKDGTFKPKDSLTKAQFIKLMVCANDDLNNKIKSIANENDTNSSWFEKYFEVANQYFLLPSEYNEENLNEKITRKEMAQILSNFIKYATIYGMLDDASKSTLDEKIKSNPNYLSDQFADALKEKQINVSDAFIDITDLDQKTKEDIFLIKDLAIIDGYTDGTFKPNNFVTRAEASKVIYMYMDVSAVVIAITSMAQSPIMGIAPSGD